MVEGFAEGGDSQDLNLRYASIGGGKASINSR
jgi:hypothetical protein